MLIISLGEIESADWACGFNDSPSRDALVMENMVR